MKFNLKNQYCLIGTFNQATLQNNDKFGTGFKYIFYVKRWKTGLKERKIFYGMETVAYRR